MHRWIRANAGVARRVIHGAPRKTTLVRPLLLAACASLLAAPALAAPPIYRLIFQRTGFGAQYNVQMDTPFQHADTYPVPDGSEAIFSGSAFAAPGHVGVDNRLEHLYSSGPARTSVYEVRSYTSTNDFVISGPGTFVEGQLHLRARASLTRSAGQSARINVDVRARTGILVAMGDLVWNNTGFHGSGLFAGLNSSELDVPFVVSGFFPVGTPFDVGIQVFGLQNSTATSPAAWTETNAGTNGSQGAFLEEVGGQVLTLPAGYTLNSVNWGVVDNHFQTTVGVDPAPTASTLELSVHPNPFAGASMVSFDQPQAAHVRLRVFDVGGRLIRTLANEWRAAGTQRFPWDGRSDDGSVAGAGLYFARVEAGSWVASQRIVRVR